MSVVEKIKNRLPGGYSYNKYVCALRFCKNNQEIEANLKRFIKELAWYEYLHGGWDSEEKADAEINMMKDIWKNQECIRIKNAWFPIPGKENVFTWNYEFNDLISPYAFIKVGKYDFSKINNAFIEGPYELNQNVSIKEGDVVIDCGANMGLFSAIASAEGAGKVYSFEPSGEIIEKYLSLTKMNNSNIEISKYALSNYIGTAEFELSDINVGGSALAKEKEDNRRYETVNVTTLDQFVIDNNIDKVDFIKSDIEGEERNMLMGAKETLKKHAPKLSICTYHYPDDPEVLEKIILDANPDYIVEHKYLKLYAYVNENSKKL